MINRGIWGIILASVLSFSSTALGQEGIRWAPDIPTARRAAAQFNVPLLIHFYGDNCLPCKLLEDRVFNRPEFVETVNKYFICVKVNATRDRQTAAQYQVHSWPTDVFVSPDGKTLFQGVCQQDINGYLNTLQNVAVMNRDRNVMLAAQRATPQSAPSGQPSGQLYSNQLANGSQKTPFQQGGFQQPNPQQAGFQQSPNAQVAAQQVAQSHPAGYVPQNQAAPNQRVQTQAALGQQGNAFATNNRPLQGTASQLPQNTALQSNVQRGPLQPSQQPLAQRGPAASSPLGSATQGYAGQGYPGAGYPPANSQAAGQNASQRSQPISGSIAGRDTRLPQYPSIPNSGQARSTNSSQPAVSTVSASRASAPSANSQSIENPYYVPKQEGASPATAEVGSEQAPPQTDATQSPAVSEPNATLAPSESQQSKEAGQAVTAGATVSQDPATVSKTDVCLEGYCPMALKRGEWLNGDSRFAVRHRGKVYWLSDQAAVDKFMEDPDAASPVLSGYDPLIFLEEGRLVPGDIHYGLHEQVSGSYLLFSSKEAKKKFWGAFDKYTNQLNSVLKAKGAK